MANNQMQNEGLHPLRAVGPDRQHAFIGMGHVLFKGSTGLVGTAFGVPGLVCSRIATGSYYLQFNKNVKDVTILPGIQAPTGSHYNINVSEVNGYSGQANMQITKHVSVPSGMTVATTKLQPCNPVSGTMANLLFFMSPRGKNINY